MFASAVLADPPIAQVGLIVASVLAEFGMGHKGAAGAVGYGKRQYFERSLAKGGSVARLALLPDEMRKRLWWRLAPLFGITETEADHELLARLNALEARLAKLEQPEERRTT